MHEVGQRDLGMQGPPCILCKSCEPCLAHCVPARNCRKACEAMCVCDILQSLRRTERTVTSIHPATHTLRVWGFTVEGFHTHGCRVSVFHAHAFSLTSSLTHTTQPSVQSTHLVGCLLVLLLKLVPTKNPSLDLVRALHVEAWHLCGVTVAWEEVQGAVDTRVKRSIHQHGAHVITVCLNREKVACCSSSGQQESGSQL